MKNGIYLHNQIINEFPEYIELETGINEVGWRVEEDEDEGSDYAWHRDCIFPSPYHFTHKNEKYGIAIANLKKQLLERSGIGIYKSNGQTLCERRDNADDEVKLYLYIFKLSDVDDEDTQIYYRVTHCVLLTNMYFALSKLMNEDIKEQEVKNLWNKNPALTNHSVKQEVLQLVSNPKTHSLSGNTKPNFNTINDYMDIELFQEDKLVGKLALTYNTNYISSTYINPYSLEISDRSMEAFDNNITQYVHTIIPELKDAKLRPKQRDISKYDRYLYAHGTLQISDIFNPHAMNNIDKTYKKLYGDNYTPDAIDDTLENLLKCREVLCEDVDKWNNSFVNTFFNQFVYKEKDINGNEFGENKLFIPAFELKNTKMIDLCERFYTQHTRPNTGLTNQSFPNSLNYLFGATHRIIDILVIPEGTKEINIFEANPIILPKL